MLSNILLLYEICILLFIMIFSKNISKYAYIIVPIYITILENKLNN